MLLKLTFAPFVLIAKGIIGLLPHFSVNSEITGFFGMISIAFQFFPSDVWTTIFATVFFWLNAYLIKSIANLVLGLLPVSMRLG